MPFKGGLRTEVVGILLITYRGGNDKQPIRWVRLSDFVLFRRELEQYTKLALQARRIHEEAEELRSMGLTDRQFAAHGIDLTQLKQWLATEHTWPIIGHRLLQDKYRRGRQYLQFNRIHRLPLRKVQQAELVQRRNAESP